MVPWRSKIGCHQKATVSRGKFKVVLQIPDLCHKGGIIRLPANEQRQEAIIDLRIAVDFQRQFYLVSKLLSNMCAKRLHLIRKLRIRAKVLSDFAFIWDQNTG